MSMYDRRRYDHDMKWWVAYPFCQHNSINLGMQIQNMRRAPELHFPRNRLVIVAMIYSAPDYGSNLSITSILSIGVIE